MSLADAIAPYEEHYRRQLEARTWGHLFPDCGYYQGKLRIASDCSGRSILDWKIDGLLGSPWLTAALSQFMNEQDSPSDGQVIEYDLGVTVRQEERFIDTSGWTDEDWWDLNYDRPESERHRPPDPEVWRVIDVASLRSRVVLEAL